MRAGQSNARFVDCAVHGAGSGAELFVVEGESAARSVAAVRSARFQAVLPLQGKPMNAWRAPAARVQSHALYAQLADALGLADATALEHADDAALAALRFDRLVLLLDPDADGIHIGALLLLYLHRWAPSLVASQRVVMSRAPMFLLQPAGRALGEAMHLAYTPEHCHRLREAMAQDHGAAPLVQAVRGLGSLAPQHLAELCVAPATRRARLVTAQDLQAAVDVFGGTEMD